MDFVKQYGILLNWRCSEEMDTPPSGRQKGQRPRMLVCYLCSGEFGSKSLPIHIPQCQKKWLREEGLKAKKERRPLPWPPATEQPITTGGGSPSAQQIDNFNDEARAAFEASLERCPHCQRRFVPKAFQHHSKSCTTRNPAKPAGTGLTSMSLTNRLVPGAIAGSKHGNATPESFREVHHRCCTAVQPPPLSEMGIKRLKVLKKQTATNASSSVLQRDPGQSSKLSVACNDCGLKYERPDSIFCSSCESKRAGDRRSPTSSKSHKGAETEPSLAFSEDNAADDLSVEITTPRNS
ncbi:uncharacterized protein [Physcomitrium patens]|uniref:uncharacterized protein isoform X1 n=1 Tax=Physcomitrium patens TaxID=3218 RepID=UPI000D1784FA|nr:zinc finger protein 474-like isoform X1 [Physcomitrium patens]|eukprot:XP_024391165.1 zinc finger protein 474-like isoform X1 [Physcomitrella patens]